MSKRSGFEHLKEDFPVFTIQNKTGVTKHIDLADGHDVPIPGKSTAKVKSAELHQMPNSIFFRVTDPDVQTLAKYGVIKVATSEDTASSNTSSKDASSDTKNTDGKTGLGISK